MAVNLRRQSSSSALMTACLVTLVAIAMLIGFGIHNAQTAPVEGPAAGMLPTVTITDVVTHREYHISYPDGVSYCPGSIACPEGYR